MSKQDQKDYWFAAKKYGWGWGLPITWQGWLVTASYLVALVGITIWYAQSADDLTVGESAFSSWQLWVFFGLLGLVVTVLFAISRVHGPTPRWRWGKLHEDDDPDTPLGKF